MSAVANRMCAAPAGGLGSWVQLVPPSAVASSTPFPSAQPCSVETKLTSWTSIGTAAATLGEGDADADGLAAAVAAVAAGLAAAEAGEAVEGGEAAGLDEPQPESATSATSATNVAAVTERPLLIFRGRRTPPAGCHSTITR